MARWVRTANEPTQGKPQMMQAMMMILGSPSQAGEVPALKAVSQSKVSKKERAREGSARPPLAGSASLAVT